MKEESHTDKDFIPKKTPNYLDNWIWDFTLNQYVWTGNHLQPPSTISSSGNNITIATNPPQYMKGNGTFGTIITSTPTTLDIVKKLNNYLIENSLGGCIAYLMMDNHEYIQYRFFMNSTETTIELWNDFMEIGAEEGAIKSLKELNDRFKRLYKTLK